MRAASIVCPEESPLLAAIIDNFDVKNSPLMGIDAPTLARGEDLHPSWGTYLLRRRSEGGAGGRAESHPASMTRDSFAVRNYPLVGIDAPTPAREKGLQPYGELTLFFRWRKKSVQKKASGTATLAARPAARRGLRSAVAPFGAVLDLGSLRSPFWGKSPLLPILTAGLAMSRAAELASLRMLSCALGARLFPPSKWAGLFPSAAYRRSAPPQSAAGRLIPCGLG